MYTMLYIDFEQMEFTMQDIILVILAICAIITYIIISTHRRKAQTDKKTFVQDFGKTPTRQYGLYDMESIDLLLARKANQSYA